MTRGSCGKESEEIGRRNRESEEIGSRRNRPGCQVTMFFNSKSLKYSRVNQIISNS